jgi:indole-3-glycerol phosphate synthase
VSTSTPTVLERILRSTRVELERREREVPAGELEERLLRGGVPRAGALRLRDALAATGIGVIAEFKRRSPSAGTLRGEADVPGVVGAYARGGAIALSVLTEGPNFDGSLADLRAAREASELPILRKDFIVDRYQLLEAREAGADAVLLIVAALAQDELESLHDSARALELEVLVEIHDGEELKRVLAVGAQTVGINNRDLRDFSVDMARTSRLMHEMPAGVRVVSESGIHTPEQLVRLAQDGVDAVLVGESLMRSADPEAALRALTRG